MGWSNQKLYRDGSDAVRSTRIAAPRQVPRNSSLGRYTPKPGRLPGLTICQPYAHLIVTPQSELPPGYSCKLVENRRWDTDYRGELLIHAGKSEKYLTDEDAAAFEKLPGDRQLVYGAIIGVARIVDCIEIWRRGDHVRVQGNDLTKHPWITSHKHAEGPWGWIFASDGPYIAAKFPQPIPWVGALGLLHIPERVVFEQLKAIGWRK